MCILIKLLIRYCVRDVTLHKLHFYLKIDAKTKQHVKLRVEMKVWLCKKYFFEKTLVVPRLQITEMYHVQG